MNIKQDDNKVVNQQNSHDVGGLCVDDPLAAIKAIRLEQLAQCRLKTQKEMQTEHNKNKP